MENTDSEHGSNDEQVITKKPRKVMERRAIWRYKPDGTYNNNPKSEAYFRDYYKEHLSAIYIECPHCKKLIGKHNYSRHLASGKKCLKIRSSCQCDVCVSQTLDKSI